MEFPVYDEITYGNYRTTRAQGLITAICNHRMEGYLAGSDERFHDKTQNASAHYGISQDGRIWQWVADESEAFANGLAYKNDLIYNPQNNEVLPDLTVPWLKAAVSHHWNPNNLTISIEHEDGGGDPTPALPFSETMYKSTLWLHQQLLAKHNIAPTRDFIIGHYQIDPVDRATCPTTTWFPWKNLILDLSPFITLQYPVTISVNANVREAPGTHFGIVATVNPGPAKNLQVAGHRKGELIWDAKRKRWDDAWVYFEDILGHTGYVSRTLIDKLPGEAA